MESSSETWSKTKDGVQTISHVRSIGTRTIPQMKSIGESINQKIKRKIFLLFKNY